MRIFFARQGMFICIHALLLVSILFISFYRFDSTGMYPDELVDAQNAVAILKQDDMKTQIVEYNKLSVMGYKIPIYGIKPYNGAILSYVLALFFLAFGVSVFSLKLASALMLMGAMWFMLKALKLIGGRWIAVAVTVIFAWSPYFAHFLRYDHGPLRLAFLVFWVCMYFIFKAIYGDKGLSRLERILLFFAIGVGINNHVVFILPLFFLFILSVLDRRVASLILPKGRDALYCFIALVTPLLPFLVDLQGYIGSWFELFRNVIQNKPALGGRVPFSEGGIFQQIADRFLRFVVQRDLTAVQVVFQTQWKVLPYLWISVVSGAFVIFSSLCFFLRKKDNINADYALLIGSILVVILALILPLISSLHHMVYIQAFMSIALTRLIRSGFDVVALTSWGKTASKFLAVLISVGFIVLPAYATTSYLQLVKQSSPKGLFSPLLLDVRAYLREEFAGRKLITHGWGSHSYIAILFGGNWWSEVFQSPVQLKNNLGLFQLDNEKRILGSKPYDTLGHVVHGGDLTVENFAAIYNLKVERTIIIGDFASSPVFALVYFSDPDQEIKVTATVNKVKSIYQSISKRLDLFAANDAKYKTHALKELGINGEGAFLHEFGGGYVGLLSDQQGAYILLSDVPSSACASLVKQIANISETRIGEFGNIFSAKINEGDLQKSCQSGNIWLLVRETK